MITRSQIWPSVISTSFRDLDQEELVVTNASCARCQAEHMDGLVIVNLLSDFTGRGHDNLQFTMWKLNLLNEAANPQP